MFKISESDGYCGGDGGNGKAVVGVVVYKEREKNLKRTIEIARNRSSKRILDPFILFA